MIDENNACYYKENTNKIDTKKKKKNRQMDADSHRCKEVRKKNTHTLVRTHCVFCLPPPKTQSLRAFNSQKGAAGKRTLAVQLFGAAMANQLGFQPSEEGLAQVLQLFRDNLAVHSYDGGENRHRMIYQVPRQLASSVSRPSPFSSASADRARFSPPSRTSACGREWLFSRARNAHAAFALVCSDARVWVGCTIGYDRLWRA